MVRTTRRKQRSSSRTQRGGGNWKTPTIDANTWKPYLEKYGLGQLLTAATAEEKMEAYVLAIARQDDLMLAARELIINMVVEKSDTEIDVNDSEMILENDTGFENNKDTIAGIIKDVLQWITLMDTPSKDSKWFSLLDPSVSDFTTLGYILYPARMQNLFVQGVARLLVALRGDPDTIDKILSASTFRQRILKQLFVDQNVAYLQSLAYSMTARKLSDGISIGSKSVIFDIDELWDNFVDELIKNHNMPTKELFKNDSGTYRLFNSDNTFDMTHIARIVAAIYVYYKNNSLDKIFENFGISENVMTDDKVQTIATHPGFPPIEGLNIKIPSLNNVPLKNLLKYMRLSQFHFMLHLRQAIRQAEETPTSE